jgi:hypothetical protein
MHGVKISSAMTSEDAIRVVVKMCARKAYPKKTLYITHGEIMSVAKRVCRAFQGYKWELVLVISSVIVIISLFATNDLFMFIIGVILAAIGLTGFIMKE